MNKYKQYFFLLLLVIFVGAISGCGENDNLDVDGVWVGQWRASGNRGQEDELTLAYPDFIWITPISHNIGTFSVSDGQIRYSFTNDFGGSLIRTNTFNFSEFDDSITIDNAMRFIRASD